MVDAHFPISLVEGKHEALFLCWQWAIHFEHENPLRQVHFQGELSCLDFLIDIHNPINNIRVGFRSYKLHNDIMVVAKLCLFYRNLPTNI
jgi:hypothetical protein